MFLSYAYNLILTLSETGWTVESVEKLPAGSQPQISPEELLKCEKIIQADREVQRLAKEVGEWWTRFRKPVRRI